MENDQKQQSVEQKTEDDGPEEIPFDVALLSVSHCLTEAEAWAERGFPRKASHLLHLAEKYALRSRYLELIRLVWSYNGCYITYAAPPSV